MIQTPVVFKNFRFLENLIQNARPNYQKLAFKGNIYYFKKLIYLGFDFLHVKYTCN